MSGVSLRGALNRFVAKIVTDGVNDVVDEGPLRWATPTQKFWYTLDATNIWSDSSSQVAQNRTDCADFVLLQLNYVVDDASLHRTSTQSRKLLYSLGVKSFCSTASYSDAPAWIQPDCSDCVALLEPSSRGAFVLFLDKNDTDEMHLVSAESIFDWITPTLVFLIKVDAKTFWSDHACFVARTRSYGADVDSVLSGASWRGALNRFVAKIVTDGVNDVVDEGPLRWATPTQKFWYTLDATNFWSASSSQVPQIRTDCGDFVLLKYFGEEASLPLWN